jgi:heme/copper-type cytochrome/quinol oxidase subunit 2
MFVIMIWLAITAFVMSRNVEFRQPMRETRGFSRAQTGDGITAVLPMTWSITMLMHASTHSVNFDENTTGTTFTFTVIAYQWGWNYYFPRDIVDVYWATPKLVGQGHADVTMDQQYYDNLLDYTRKNVSAKQTNAMRYASKMGKNVAPNALALFLRTPFTLSDQQLPMFFDSAFMSATQTRAGDVAASRALASEVELAAGA